MTNEEWFESLSTEEKAKWLAKKCRSVSAEYYHENQTGSWESAYWEWWLKQAHKE